MTRKEKLEKALAFEYIHSMGSNDYERGLNDGVELENARLAPLHAALIEAVCMLELLGCEKAKLGNSFTRYKSRIALAKIDDVLDSLQSSPNYKPEREESGT